MQARQVSNAALGQLRPASQADIQRSMQRAQWRPAQHAAHAKSMQQLHQVAMRFARMQQAARPRPTPAQKAPAPAKVTPRHNSVAQRGYTQRRAAAPRPSPSHVPIHPNVAAARQRNMQRDARAAQRQAFRQQAVTRTQNAMRAVGNWVRQQRPVQAVKTTLTAQRSRIQQHIARATQPRSPQPPRKEQQRGQDRAR